MQNKVFTKSEPFRKNVHCWYISLYFIIYPEYVFPVETKFYFNITFEIKVSRVLPWNLCQINFWDSMKLKMNS